MPSEIALPFHLGLDGRVVMVSDPDAQIRQHVWALINTQPAERVTVPGYGVPTMDLVFEGNDGDDVATLATTMITEAMETHEPGVLLQGVTVNPDTEENLAKVDVLYARRDAADSGTVANANEAIIGASGVVREVVRG